MAQFPRRLKTLANQLGVPTPDDVKAIFEEDSETVAEIVRESLENVIKQVQSGSQTGALDGYIAVKRKADEATKLVLRNSGIDLSGNYEWIIFTAPSAQHAELDLNLFNLLDRGRPALPKKQDGKPYPLWGALANVTRSNARIQGSEGSLKAGRNPSAQTDFRQEPRQQNQRSNLIPFTFGPIQAVPGQHLYEAALRRAKDRLTVKGLNRRWDVIKVGFE